MPRLVVDGDSESLEHTLAAHIARTAEVEGLAQSAISGGYQTAWGEQVGDHEASDARVDQLRREKCGLGVAALAPTVTACGRR